MKKIIVLYSISALLSSCFKKRYCDCYDSTGVMTGTFVKTTANKNKFERDCKDPSKVKVIGASSCKVR